MSNLRRLRQQVVGHKRENSEDADDLWACRRRHLLPAISERASTWATATIMPSFDPTALEALLKQYTDPTAPLEARVPGWAFVVRSKDTVLYRKGAGNLEPSTPGWMASVSKLVTPILALKAVESGLITLDTPLQPLIPDVDLSRVLTGFSAEGTPQYESARAPVTLSNAMMHTSGLSYTFVNEALLRLHGMTPMSALRDGLKTSNRTIFGPLVAQPDAAWNYSGGLAVAGFAIEAVTGKTLDEYLQEVICKPLGLKHTSFGDAPAGTPETISQRATMSDPTTEWIQTSDWLLPLKKSCCGTGGESLWSSADDMATLLLTLLDGGKPIFDKSSSADLLFKDLLDSTTRPFFEQNNPDPRTGKTGFGLGYQITLEDDPETGRPVGTAGWPGLSGPYCWVDRKKGLVASMMLQHNQLPREELTYNLRKAFEKAVYSGVASS